MRLFCLLPMAALLGACAAPEPFVAPSVAGKARTEVARLVAASEAPLFPCTFTQVSGDTAMPLSGKRTDVTLAPGRYVVSLECASAYHSFKPQVELTARPGRSYRITGYLVDNSVTIFTMKMRVKIEELPQ